MSEAPAPQRVLASRPLQVGLEVTLAKRASRSNGGIAIRRSISSSSAAFMSRVLIDDLAVVCDGVEAGAAAEHPRDCGSLGVQRVAEVEDEAPDNGKRRRQLGQTAALRGRGILDSRRF